MTNVYHVIKIANRSLKNVGKIKYLEKKIIYQNYIHEEIKSRLNSGNFAVIHFSVEKLF
jgi:hypothetical protein